MSCGARDIPSSNKGIATSAGIKKITNGTISGSE
jgi:hypothetical protein